MIKPDDIRRLELGHYTMPADSRWPGQKIVVCSYLVRFDAGLLLFDTGIGRGHADVEMQYGPIQRRPIHPALAALGLQATDVTRVANCHLHLDHCGNNPLFPHTPIFVQKQELDAMSSLDFVLPELVDFDGVALEVHEGEAQIAPGLRIIPTPGHTPGHQSLLIDTSQGRILLAGQAMDSASEFARAQFALALRESGSTEEAPNPPLWLCQLREHEVRLVLFAHDLLSWDRDRISSELPQM
jgi:glyoxylase-like metal-dependent hydrolase (beta-lactamase superfamily II)